MTLPVISIIFLLLLFQTTPVVSVTPCHICGAVGNEGLKFPNVIIDDVGKTCADIAITVAISVLPATGECSAMQTKWSLCCNGVKPQGRDVDNILPKQIIPVVRHIGPHPVCNLCRDKDYPFATSMVINFLYIGVGSCAQYWKYGMEGRIQSHMCDVVKHFAHEPCGCGVFNPYFNTNHSLCTPPGPHATKHGSSACGIN